MLSEQMICAIITVVIMTFGLITNTLVLITARKMSSMRSSFGIITKNQAVCNLAMCVLFLIFVGPLQLSPIKVPFKYTHFIGTISMIIYEIAAQLNFFNSLNRFCAVYLIFAYDSIFSNFNTRMLRNLACLTSVVICVVFYELLGCYLFFDETGWYFNYAESSRCDTLTWYCDFIFNMGLVALTLSLNLLAAYKARKLHRLVSDTTGVGISAEQKKREMSFIKQSFFQGVSMSVALIFYRLTSPLFENPILIFLNANVWAFMLAFEGGIILLSNQEMRTAIKKKRTVIFSLNNGNLDYTTSRASRVDK